jgi:hypothetical protein
MKNQVPNKYCRHCGRELMHAKVDADYIEVSMYDSGGGSWWRLASPFNPQTGERNVATVHRCIDYQRTWHGENDHDMFVEYEGEIHWGVRIKLK